MATGTRPIGAFEKGGRGEHQCGKVAGCGAGGRERASELASEFEMELRVSLADVSIWIDDDGKDVP